MHWQRADIPYPVMRRPAEYVHLRSDFPMLPRRSPADVVEFRIRLSARGTDMRSAVWAEYHRIMVAARRDLLIPFWIPLQQLESSFNRRRKAAKSLSGKFLTVFAVANAGSVEVDFSFVLQKAAVAGAIDLHGVHVKISGIAPGTKTATGVAFGISWPLARSCRPS